MTARRALGAMTLGVGAAAAALRERKLLSTWAVTGVMSRRPLVGPVRLPDGVEWWDDWFTIEEIDDQTWAIGEPRYYKLNHSYLIIGSERALLFDSGPGVRPIGAVVDDLSKVDVVALASHLHFDHIGGHVDFDSIGLVTIPGRIETDTKWFRPSRRQHMGTLEAGARRPLLQVAETFEIGGTIELGDRSLEIIHTPGHTKECVSLFDRSRNLLFSGDTMYEGELLAALPDSDITEYRASAARLLDSIYDDTLVLGAHTTPERPRAPRLERFDLIDLERVLADLDPAVHSRFGMPQRHYVNDRLRLLVA